jgi:hypothetical protein
VRRRPRCVYRGTAKAVVDGMKDLFHQAWQTIPKMVESDTCPRPTAGDLRASAPPWGNCSAVTGTSEACAKVPYVALYRGGWHRHDTL